MKKSIDVLIVIMFMIINLGCMIWVFKNYVIGSDNANAILQAQDIVRGNILYKGWNLSQISFLFSDVVFYSIGYLIFGIDRYTALTAFIISNLITQMVLYFLCIHKKDYSLNSKLATMGVLILPPFSLLRINIVHFGCWIYCIIGYILYAGILEESDKKKAKNKRFCLLVVWILGIFSDFLIFLFGALPCFLYSILIIYQDEKRTISYRSFKNPMICIYSFIIAYMLEAVYYIIGGANRVGTVAGFEFVSVKDWGTSTVRLIEFLLEGFGANFTGKKALLPDNILRCFNAVLLLFSINYFIMTLVNIYRKKRRDILSEIAAITIVIGMIVFIMTTRSRDSYSLIIIYLLYAILVRNIHILWSRSGHNLKINVLAGVFIIILAMCGRGYDIVMKGKIPYSDDHEEVCSYLKENNLNNGYGSFLNASICTILSKDKVHVRHIEKGSRGMSEFMWFNKNEWYKEEANYIIINTESETNFGITEENVLTHFGTPKKIESVGRYLIYIYDKDLSKELVEGDSRSIYF